MRARPLRRAARRAYACAAPARAHPGSPRALRARARTVQVIDANVRFACDLHAHNLLLFRTVGAGELDFDAAQTLACGIVYLQTRHRWNLRLLGVARDGGALAPAVARARALLAIARARARLRGQTPRISAARRARDACFRRCTRVLGA